MSSRVTGAPAGKHGIRGANGRFAPRTPPADPAPETPERPAPPPAPAPHDDAASPSLLRRVFSTSLGDLVRGR